MAEPGQSLPCSDAALAAAAAPGADDARDVSPLLSPPSAPARTVAGWRRRLLLRAAGAALVAGAVAAVAAFRAPGAIRPWPRRGTALRDGFGPALAVKQQYPGGAVYAPAPEEAAGAGGVAWGYGPAEGAASAGGAAAEPEPAPEAASSYGSSAAGEVAAAGYAGGGGQGPSLYCYALIVPFGGEVKLLQYQLRERISLFACNDYQVFSNTSISLGPDSAQGGAPLTAVSIGMSLQIARGGRWGTALNTDIFIRLWQVVAQQGRWQSNDWSVKLDADAVFLPERLRAMLGTMPSPGAKFINNCRWGMHGPVEVLSRDGFGAYAAKSQRCEPIRRDAMQWQPVHWNEKMHRWIGTDKEHSFGEDQYLRRCLRLLQVGMVNEFKLLDELACGSDPQHTGCVGSYVAYHPFKDVDQYETCLASAQLETAQPER